MEDQGKRLLLTVGMVAVLYLVWTTFFMPKPAPPPPAPPVAAAPAPASPAAGTPAPAAGAEGQAAAPAAAGGAAETSCDPAKEEAPARWETPDYIATFSRCGGAVSSFVLKGPQYGVKKDGATHQIDLVHARDNAAYLPLQLQVDMPPAGSTNPDDRRQPIIPVKAAWTLVSSSDADAVFRWVSPDGAIQVTKTFKRIPQTRFAIGLDFEVRNVSSKPGDKRVATSSLVLFGYQDPGAPDRSMFKYSEPKWGTACYIDGSLKTETEKDLLSEARVASGDVKWVAIDHQYFLIAAAPVDREAGGLVCGRSSVPGTGFIEAQLRYDLPSTLEPNQSFKQSVVVYAGPKLIDELEGVSKAVAHETKLGDAVDLGWFAFLARPMLLLLKLFHSWIGSWGLAIILLTILVKLATLYWTTKSMRSMKAMSQLKPEMDKLREKFPDDKAKQNEEMLKLYKTHKISPFGGCLPMFLQMPVWFALYRTLSASADLFRAPFTYIQDLTAPDPYYILPVLMVLLMIVQTRVSPTAADSQQQKVMQWTMPAVLGLMSLIFAAGLAVYMLTNSVLGIAHQFYMNRTDPKRLPPPAPKSEPARTTPPSKGKKNGAKA